MISLEKVFAEDGIFARAIPGFQPREQQTNMAQQIALAIKEMQVLIAEAGTGTGKTYAYLAPALLAGGKVIVSTGTKTLQDQLFKRDLPTVRDALKVPVTVALLKGRANYVCHYHLKRNVQETRFLTPQDALAMRAIVQFSQITHSGDKAECAAVPEEASVWQFATSTRDSCLGQDCPDAKECFVTAARKNAMDAEVVVVNHHLFFADLALRDGGIAELLPASNTVIFDEAHQLPETASLFFGENLSTAQMLDLARDTRSETITGARDCVELVDRTRLFEKAVRDLRLSIDAENTRLAHHQLEKYEDFPQALDDVEAALNDMHTLLVSQAERSEGLAACARRAEEMLAALANWQVPSQPEVIRWVEVFSQALSLNLTPLHIAHLFRRQLEERPRAWIFTSATLAVGADFGHYSREMGLSDLSKPVQTAIWGSPFDYAKQSMLYAPLNMPDPNSPAYSDAVAHMALPLIRAAKGRTFVLCTSLRAMRHIHGLLSEFFENEKLPYPLLLQGEGSRTELLTRFREKGNAVLVASQSFWEGVDVPGDALSVVIIDKLPFAPPDDPVLAARIEHIKTQGLNPFMLYQLPRAVISMKQGAGRLIRTVHDKGVLAIADPRMTSKPYGRRIWQSLPPMRRSRVEAEVIEFLENLNEPDR